MLPANSSKNMAAGDFVNKRIGKMARKANLPETALHKHVHETYYLSTNNKMLNVAVWRKNALRVARKHPTELELPGSDEEIDSEQKLKRFCKIEQEFATLGQNEFTFTSFG